MVNKAEVLPPSTNPLLPEWAISGERTSIQRVLVMDVGSTNIKFAYHETDKGLHLPDAKTQDTSKFRNIHFRDYIGIQYFGSPGGFYGIKVANSEVLSDVRRNVEEMEQVNGPADMYVLTGFINSLVVSYTVDDGRKTVILPDEPSATTELSPRQHAAIWHTMPDKRLFEQEGLKPTSSLMKIAFLQDHPQVIQGLFGDDISFGQLQISTMRGIITNMLIDRRDPTNKLPLLIPAGGDTMAFAGGNVGIGLDEMRLMLRGIGLADRQIHFLGTPMVIHRLPEGSEIKIFNVQDFHANLWLINELIDMKRLSEHVAYLECDSKMKHATRRKIPSLPGLRTLGNIEYFVQEMGTKAINNVGRQLAEQDWHLNRSWDWDYYAFLKILFEEYVSRPSERFFYYPDKGITGTLVDTAGGMVKVVDSTTDLTRAGYSHEEIKEMILAVACGIVFGLRRKQQEIRTQRNEKDPPVNYIYGGFVCYDRYAREIVAQCLDGEVYLLEIPYAGQSAVLQAMHEMRALDLNNFQVRVEKSQTEFRRDEEFDLWLNTREKLPVAEVNQSNRGIIYLNQGNQG